MYILVKQLLIGISRLKIDIQEQEFLPGSVDKKILAKVRKGSIIFKAGGIFH